MAAYDETKYEHGKKISPLLQELGAEGIDLARAHDVILTLLPLSIRAAPCNGTT